MFQFKALAEFSRRVLPCLIMRHRAYCTTSPTQLHRSMMVVFSYHVSVWFKEPTMRTMKLLIIALNLWLCLWHLISRSIRFSYANINGWPNRCIGSQLKKYYNYNIPLCLSLSSSVSPSLSLFFFLFLSFFFHVLSQNFQIRALSVI